MNAYANMTVKSLAANYRAAYQNHLTLSQAYADGSATADELRASADNLKAIRTAHRAESEANQVRRI
jgi:hypothetical protein